MRSALGPSFKIVFRSLEELNDLLPPEVFRRVKVHLEAEYLSVSGDLGNRLYGTSLDQFGGHIPNFCAELNRAIEAIRSINPYSMDETTAISAMVERIPNIKMFGTDYNETYNEIMRRITDDRNAEVRARIAGQPPPPPLMNLSVAQNLLKKRWKELEKENKEATANYNRVNDAIAFLAERNIDVNPPPAYDGATAFNMNGGGAGHPRWDQNPRWNQQQQPQPQYRRGNGRYNSQYNQQYNNSREPNQQQQLQFMQLLKEHLQQQQQQQFMQQLKEQQQEFLKQLRGSADGATATANLASCFPPDTRATFNPEDLCESDEEKAGVEPRAVWGDDSEDEDREDAKTAKRGWGLF